MRTLYAKAQFLLITFALLIAGAVPAQLQTPPGAPALKTQTTTKTTTTTTTKRKPRRRTTKRKTTTTTKTTVVSVPVGTDLKVRLNDTLSSKDSRVGDRFSATVLSPSRFEEGKLYGHISSIQK
jgi:acyl-CoA synthetase (AMP-forming)/AMP-acid ligase II